MPYWSGPRGRRNGRTTVAAIGAAHIEPGTSVVLLAVHVYREEDHGEEIIRIISARAAEEHEIRRYQEQAMD